MVLSFAPQAAFAETGGTTDDGFWYTISDDGKVTGTGYSGKVTHKNLIDGSPYSEK